MNKEIFDLIFFCWKTNPQYINWRITYHFVDWLDKFHSPRWSCWFLLLRGLPLSSEGRLLFVSHFVPRGPGTPLHWNWKEKLLTLCAVSKLLRGFGVGLRSSSLHVAMIEVILRSIPVPSFNCCRIHRVSCEYSNCMAQWKIFEYSQGTVWILQQQKSGQECLLKENLLILQLARYMTQFIRQKSNYYQTLGVWLRQTSPYVLLVTVIIAMDKTWCPYIRIRHFSPIWFLRFNK